MDRQVVELLECLKPNDRSKISVNQATGCWEWTAARGGDGYGQIKRHGRVWKAHRYVYHTLVRELPANVYTLDHLCRVRLCVNPNHLEVVEKITNTRRGAAAVSVKLPDDLLAPTAALIRKAYRLGVLEGLRQASEGKGQ